MKTLKYSRQRESIKANLMSRHDHPTADALYASIREEFPNISLGTVYRNLNLLVETGEILKLTCGNGPDHYDGNVTPHYHFVCRDCGQVYDMELDEMADLNTSVQAAAPGKIDSHSILFYGRCYSCMEKEETDEEKQASAAWERRQLEIMEWITNDVDGLTGEHHPPCVRLGWHQ